MVLSVLFLLVAGPALSYAQTPQHPAGNITPFSYPTVEITINKTTSFNLSLEYVCLVRNISNHTFFYSAVLRMGKWNVNTNGDNISYSSTLYMRPEIPGKLLTAGNRNPGHSQKPLTVHMQVNITKSSSVPLMNTSNQSVNSTMKITYYLKFNTEIPGSGYVVIAQGIAENGKFHLFNLVPHNNEWAKINHDFDHGLIFSNETTNNTFAEFWWMNSYQLNGKQQNLSSNFTIGNKKESLIFFRYNYTDGIRTVFQDPYFTIYGLNIFSYPILKQDLEKAYNFIIIHLEELIAGSAIGSALIGMTYASYRRRRI